MKNKNFALKAVLVIQLAFLIAITKQHHVKFLALATKTVPVAVMDA